jgi:hypothetical protein
MPTDHPAKQPSFWQDDELKRRCKVCGESKPLSMFYLTSKKTSRQWQCKECQKKATREWGLRNPEWKARLQRKNELKRKYGLTRDQFEAMLQEQHGVCAICKGNEQLTKRKREPLCVDHKHDESRAIRGLLCRRCNVIVGMVENNPELFRAAADYLEKHERAVGRG